MKILLIEDEPALLESIASYLKQEGYLCEVAKSYATAEEKIHMYQYDCVLVDITLPGGNGLDLIRILKKAKASAGIIIISAKNSVDDKVSGLDIGADDYLAKPFNLSELNSRIRSVLRRRNHDGNREVAYNEITIKPGDQVAFIDKKPLALTKKEYDLLLFLITNKHRVITKETIAEHLWGDDMDMSDSYDFIYTHIKNLRRKLIDHGGEDYIKTVYGMGYRFGS